MTCKNTRLSFIRKGIITMLLGLLLVLIIPSAFLLFVYWFEMPILIKIFWPIVLLIIFLGTIITPLNGMIITKKGNVIFLPDFRLKIFNIKNLERIAIVFKKCENNKYSAMIKILYKNGKVFIKDYSNQFKNMKNKKLIMSLYTITENKVKNIFTKLLNYDFLSISII